MTRTYSLYLEVAGERELLRASTDPSEVRRVARSRKLARRLRRLDTKLILERDGRAFRLDHLDELCLQMWLQNPTHHTPWS